MRFIFLSPFVAVLLTSIALTSTTIAKQENSNSRNSNSRNSNSENSVEYLTSDETTSLNLPFSEAVRVGNTLYLSGVIGNIPGKKKLVSGGIQGETKQVMENIKRILQRNGSSLDRVVKCTVMLADIKEWSAMNQVYVTYFPKDRLPARSAFGTSGLALGARVEIGCIATVEA